jgi:hypothetical protein
MTEVASAAAILIDPGQPAAAAETIAAQWSTLATLKVEGFENIHRFSMDKTIDGYIAAYEAAIQQQIVR